MSRSRSASAKQLRRAHFRPEAKAGCSNWCGAIEAYRQDIRVFDDDSETGARAWSSASFTPKIGYPDKRATTLVLKSAATIWWQHPARTPSS
jgi:predicted metalloendopeptidase